MKNAFVAITFFLIGIFFTIWIKYLKDRRDRFATIYIKETPYGEIKTIKENLDDGRISVYSAYVINGKVFRQKKNRPYPRLAAGVYSAPFRRFGENDEEAPATPQTIDSITNEHIKWVQDVERLMTENELNEQLQLHYDKLDYTWGQVQFILPASDSNNVSFHWDHTRPDTLFVVDIWSKDTLAKIIKKR
jgi:hypothetical protein